MEESFTLWHDPSTSVVHREEVICGIDNGCAIMQTDPGAHDGYGDVCQEVVVQEDVVTETIVPEVSQEQDGEEVVDGGNIMYLTADNVLVMQQAAQPVVTFQDHFMECQVTEEVITDDWVNTQGEERVEIPVGEVGAEQQIEYDDMEVPLPTDQDEYTASRPYPCDFCSRRFRKKANLMNHMVAHQTDRPHGCNLCGARYIRKCDLMNHLKIHAYVPDPDALDDEELPPLSDAEEAEKTTPTKKKKSGKKRKQLASSPAKPKIKQENTDSNDQYDIGSAARSYNYVEEDVRLLTEMENHVNASGRNDSYSYNDVEQSIPEARYPILDPRKPFVCQHCGVAFAREKALASHARIHAGDSPFECETCNEMFWDVTVLREHVRSKHVCGMRFHRTDLLRRHMRSHSEVKEEFNNEVDFGHVCNVCGQSFSEALDLLAHAESHARQLGHRCMLCGEGFIDESTMAAHVMQRHGKNMPPNTCMLCGKTCKDRRTLLKHSWDHSREKLFSCSKCGKSFHNKARLKRHMVSHRNKAVQCDVCGDDFPDGRSLMNHRHSHSNISGRQFPCRECGKTFGSRSSQQIHIRIHTGERPYGCRFCWKAFADGGTLRKHERIHTGEKPYACAVCPRAFNQRVVLREHIRSHHSGPDPQFSHTMTPYSCGVCSDMFATSQDLIVHLIHHCDLNTAMKRQPQVGPRKYKRRRKLKPHELEMISNRVDNDHDVYSDSDERNKRRGTSSSAAATAVKKTKSSPPVNKTNLDKDYESVIQSFESAIQNINSLVNSKPISNRGRKKSKPAIELQQPAAPSRPKMIHTQKTRVPVDPVGEGKGRHKTKTLITRTTPAELAREKAIPSVERNRPRTKNVSYHVLQAEKLPVATFGDEQDDDPNRENTMPETSDEFHAVMIKPDPDSPTPKNNNDTIGSLEMEYQTVETEIPDVANEETVLAQVEATPVTMIKVTKNSGKKNNSLTPGRHIIGPGNKVIRIVKGGMIVSNNKVKKEPIDVYGDGDSGHHQLLKKVKEEVIEPSPLHELAELSMQHAQNQFRCEMCSATFTDRSQLLMHVPIHI
ncbi:uncharacterized protein CBL_09867 [Carabus blaptoides fortunei]